MDIKEMSKHKAKLQVDLTKLCHEFEKTIGCSIDSVSFIREAGQPCTEVRVKVTVGVL